MTIIPLSNDPLVVISPLYSSSQLVRHSSPTTNTSPTISTSLSSPSLGSLALCRNSAYNNSNPTGPNFSRDPSSKFTNLKLTSSTSMSTHHPSNPTSTTVSHPMQARLKSGISKS